MSARTQFSDEDVKRIAAAVRQAEVSTSGEIVPVIVDSSSEYSETYWKALLVGFGVGLAAYELYLWGFAGWTTGFWSALLGMPMFLFFGALLSVLAERRLISYKRMLVSQADMDQAVHHRAVKAFVDHEVFSTRDRTGILLLVSLFEHKVEVLGDAGINAAVAPEDWFDVVAEVVKGIKQDQMTDGLIGGIERCGKLLNRRGLEITPDDTDELSNQPRFE